MDGGDLFWLFMLGGPALLVLFVIMGAFFSVKRAVKHGVQIENIRAQLILPTTDYQAMEKFLLAKEPYLAPDMIQQLINRIQELKTDALQFEEFDSKLRIASPQTEDLQEEAPFNFGKALIEREMQRRK